MCGNHSDRKNGRTVAQGSPPRVREPRNSLRHSTISGRITPACAGTTRRGCRCNGLLQDHPRVCGNHCAEIDDMFDRAGSPPRVREPPHFLVLLGFVFGITPACAGTTET